MQLLDLPHVTSQDNKSQINLTGFYTLSLLSMWGDFFFNVKDSKHKLNLFSR